MQRRDALRLMAGAPVAAFAVAWPAAATAQVTRGFDQVLGAIATGEEIQRQPDLWVFEVNFKPMRMIYVDVTEPKTGKASRDQVWYLAYRVVNRSLAARQDTTNTTPVNVLDPLPGKIPFIPEFTLSTYEQQQSEVADAIALDEVIPEAVARVNAVERRRRSEAPFLSSIDIIQPVPPTVADDDQNPEWIYGVATWRNIDPDTDFFSVTMRGFSNGYEVRQGPDGQPIVWRRAVVQKFTRRGDRYDPNQAEFEFDGPPRWVYLPDPAGDAPAAPVAAPNA